MKHLKTYKLFESTNTKLDLEDIFLDVKDSHPEERWFYWVDGDDVSNHYTVYISFGNEEPYYRNFDEVDEDDDEGYQSDYPEVQISKELMDCVHRAIEYMQGWKFTILLQDEYSSDPSEDNVEKIELEDLEVGQWMAENQAIKIIFRK